MSTIDRVFMQCLSWKQCKGTPDHLNIKVSYSWFSKKRFAFTDSVLKSQIPITKFQIISKSEKPISETYRIRQLIFYDEPNSFEFWISVIGICLKFVFYCLNFFDFNKTDDLFYQLVICTNDAALHAIWDQATSGSRLTSLITPISPEALSGL